MAISTNQKPTIYRNLYENTGPARHLPAQDSTNASVNRVFRVRLRASWLPLIITIVTHTHCLICRHISTVFVRQQYVFQNKLTSVQVLHQCYSLRRNQLIRVRCISPIFLLTYIGLHNVPNTAQYPLLVLPETTLPHWKANVSVIFLAAVLCKTADTCVSHVAITNKGDKNLIRT